MRIAVLAHVRHPIAPPFMGGIEAHAWHLVRALEARGHDVTLLASGDSDPALPLRPVLDQHYDRRFPWHDFHGTDTLNAHLDTAFARACGMVQDGAFDIVHNNSLHRFPPRYSRAMRQPMVTSLHVPPFEPLQRAMADSLAPWHLVTATSHRHGAAWWPQGAPGTVRIVPNGIDAAAWPYRERGDGTAVWSGRIAPNKGTHLAVEAAAIGGWELDLYGHVEHEGYFRDHVCPALTARIRYGGHLSQPDLARRIGAASVYLFTPTWDEPFGLAAIEALCCGVPVAALDNGAVREVLGPCGAYAEAQDAAHLARAMDLAASLPRSDCRDRVLARFTREAMIARYEALYSEAIAARERPDRAPDYSDLQLRIAGS